MKHFKQPNAVFEIFFKNNTESLFAINFEFQTSNKILVDKGVTFNKGFG